jgi:tetratricopeptide (TPR) repeat protein
MTTELQQGTKNLETFSLIWLDGIINDSIENIETQQRLRTSINHLKTFQDADECIQYIESLPKDRFVLIVSGRLGQQVVPRIHNLRQVYSIYVYCLDKERNEQWAKRYPKIKGVIIKLDELVTQIRSNHEKRSQTKINEPLPITFFLTNNENNELNDHFIYSQLLIDYLLNIKPTLTDEKELISLCKDEYKGNENELNIIREFEADYSSDRAIWWYTRETCLYRLLNKAFRIQNVDLLIIFRFFIRDIQRLIEQNKCTNSLYVYRSYLISNEEIQLFKNSIGEFLSINGFFSANIHRQQTISYLNNPDITNDHEKVLFEILVDPLIDPTKPFCNITALSYYSSEEQIIFTLGSIFRLDSIHQQDDGKDRIWIIRMRLSNDKNKKFKYLFEQTKNQYNTEEINILSFGKILRKMNKYDEAEKFYRRLLKELPYNHPNIVDCHYGLGIVLDEKGDYESSIEWHQKSIEIKKQILKANNPSIGYSYNSIANVYQKKGDYKHAIEYYTKALNIWKKIFGENHPDVAMCLNNIGCLYENEKKYSEALEYHQKALAIKTIHLSNDHFNLSATHNNLASVYGNTGQLDLALNHFNLSLKIKTKSHPINHPEIALTLKNIGLIYEIKGDFSQAKLFFEKSATIRRHLFSSTHPDVIRIEQDIKRVLLKL